MSTQTLVSQTAIALILFGCLFYLFHKLLKGASREFPKIVYGAAVFIAGLMLNWVGLTYYYGAEENPGVIFTFGRMIGITLKMFAFDWESEVWSPLASEDFFFRIAITLCFIAAVVFSASVLLQVLFKVFEDFKNSVSLFFLTRFSKKMWIIAGKSVHQKILLESLGPEQKRNTIIIPDESAEEAKKEYIDQGFLVISGRISAAVLKRTGFFDSRETALIAISGDDVENLEIARTITEHLQTLSDESRRRLRFSALIMYTNIERAEHFKFSKAAGGKIQFFNPYAIAARSFLFDNPITKFIPPNHINTGKACLTGKFDFIHIFIGFGKANRELFKQSIAANQILGTDYHALVIDSSMEDGKSAFMNQCRGLFANEDGRDGALYFPLPQEKYHIDFMECNVLSKEMYDTVIKHSNNADASAVVISLGNAQLNAETAMELRQRCYVENSKETNIFVRARERSPIVAGDVLNENEEIKITPFGFEDAILTLDNIINRDMDILAKHIAENYSGDTSVEYPAKWDELSNHERESNLYAALSVSVKLNLLGFKLIYDETGESTQDENVIKEFEDAYGIDRAHKLRSEKDYLAYIERNADGSIADTARNNLARLEHQRWNAYHLVKGWTPLPKSMVSAKSRKNEREKKHACITTFEGLDELSILQASLSGEKTQRDYDTMHLDCDQMDCLAGNLKDTKYRIVKV